MALHSALLWSISGSFSAFNNALNAVLTSTGSSGDARLVHTLVRAQLLPGEGSVAGCDRVELWQRVYSLTLADGQLDWSDELTRSYDVQTYRRDR